MAQCKLIKSITPKAIIDIVDEFLKGTFVADTKEFILCISHNLQQPKFEAKLKQAIEKLARHKIDFVVWDEHGLNVELRNSKRHDIVLRYFGKEALKAFYGDEIKLHQEKRKYAALEDYIERTIQPYKDYTDHVHDPYRHYRNKPERKTVLQLFQDHKGPGGLKTLVLSTAGYGKTIEMEHIAAHYSGPEELLYPIRNYLRDYQDQTIGELLAYHQTEWNQIPDGRLLLIFDGMDEIEKNKYNTFISHLNQFVEARPGVHILISSRTNFYEISITPLRNFDTYILNSFTKRDIDKYLQSKLGSSEGAFRQKLQQSKLFEYIENPYYLTRLVQLFKDSSSPFPNSKTEMLDGVFSLRFKKEKAQRGIQIGKAEFDTLMQYIATAMTLMGRSNLLDEEIAELLH